MYGTNGPTPGGRAHEPTDDLSSTPTSTGTTVVALTTADAVVMATDRRASVAGRFVTNKDVRKVEAVHPTAAVAISGSVGGAQSFLRVLRSEASLYETRRGKAMPIEALATYAGTLLRSNPTFATVPLLGGVEQAPHVYDLDGAGGVMESDYAAGGSGMQVAYGHLEGAHRPDLTVEEGQDLAISAVRSASERDVASGNGVVVATVTREGVTVEEVGPDGSRTSVGEAEDTARTGGEQ